MMDLYNPCPLCFVSGELVELWLSASDGDEKKKKKHVLPCDLTYVQCINPFPAEESNPEKRFVAIGIDFP